MEIKLPFTETTAARFDALYQYLHRKYQLVEHQITIDSHLLRIYSVGDIDRLVDELILKHPDDIELKDERLPYWAEIWPAARALAQYLVQHPETVQRQECLEIGCGVGLVGIVARQLGAHVMVSDYQEDALRISELNWLVNVQEVPEAVLMDWRIPELPRQFPVILASDVAYEERFFLPLVAAFRRLLQPGGHVLLSEPNRQIARKFFELLIQEGFTYRNVQIPVEVEGKTVQVGVYNIVKSPA